MDIFDFENRLKNHTDNSRGEVDMNRLLNDLNIKPQGRSYRKYIYFFVSGIALVGLSYLTYSNSQSSRHEISQSTVVLEEAASLNNTETEVKNTIINENPISEVSPTILPNKKSNSTAASANSKRLNKNKTENISTTKKPAQKTLLLPKQVTKNILTPSEFAPKVENVSSNEQKIIADSNASNTEETNLASATLRNNIEAANLLPTSTISLLDNFDRGLSNKKTICPQFSERLWHMYIIPEVGYTFPMKTLSLTDENFRFIFTERLAHESTIEGINASLFLQFKNQITGLYVKPGVSYSRFTERIDFVSRDIEIDTSSVTTIIRDTDGEIISEITEEVITENERVTRSRVHYQLHEFELPVALGYSLNLNQFSIDIEAGIKLNFLQKATGQILSSGAEFIDLGNNDVDLFKNSVGLGFFGGILLKKPLNSRTELYLAPRFSFNTLAYSSNSNPINQQYNVLGLHAGLIHAIY